MRRFFLFCVIIICFLCAGFLKGSTISIFDFTSKQNQSYVLSLSKLNAEIEEKKVHNFDLEEVVRINRNNAEIFGQTSFFDLEKFKKDLNLKIISCEEISGRLVITGFSNKLSKFAYVNGKRINVQVSLSAEIVKVGSPLILGSF